MRLALVTDIHANLEALSAVLDDVEAEGVDRIVVLGDIVGYGADPGPCVEAVADLVDKGAVALLGNHDQAAFLGPKGMSETAATAIRWTIPKLGDDHIRFLKSLPLAHHGGDALFVHASAHHPESWPYVMEASDAAASFASTDARVIVSGHTHVPALFHTIAGALSTGKMLSFRPVADKAVPLSPIRRYHAVIGAVGQPRDGDSRACWGLYDLDGNEITWRRVPYDVEAAARKIEHSGLPERLAARLFTGR